ncbi:MAG: hypothetical protein WDW38_007594 [Sanguina aurantia]
MSSVSSALAVILVAALAVSAASAQTCPPSDVAPVQPFSIASYISAPWYVQKQLPLSFQPVSELFCVRATYTLMDPKNASSGLNIYNYANKDKVNGPAVGSSGSGGSSLKLVAVLDPSGPDSKLLVGPAFLQKLMPFSYKNSYGPYWVIATGQTGNSTSKGQHYDYAIISGGAPMYKTQGGCSTLNPSGHGLGMDKNSGGGLWFFTRKQVDPNATAIMLQKAKDLGLDTSGLLNVPQAGCKYTGAV